MADTSFFDEPSLAWEEEGLFARDVDGQLIRLEAATQRDYEEDIELTIDGQPVTIKKAVPRTDSQGNIINDREGQTIPRRSTIYDAAAKCYVKRPGDVNPIPILCHQEHMTPAGLCRICVVEVFRTIEGKRKPGSKLLPACHHQAESGMEVHTFHSPDDEARRRVRNSAKVLVELLAADHLHAGPREAGVKSQTPNELQALAERLGADPSRFAPQTPADRGRDNSSLLIAVDHNSCILCERCVRACDEVKKNLVIGRTGKGYTARIGFDLDQPLGQSTCVSCGECMISCPTDALTFRRPVVSAWWRDLVEDSKRPQYTAITVEELKQHPLFRSIPYKFLQWNAASVVRRRVKAGDVLCRQGEFGATAFILNQGQFGIYVGTPDRPAASERPGGLAGIVGRWIDILRRPEGSASNSAGQTESAPLAVHGQLVATMTEQDLLVGEMTCLSDHPRTATVVAMGEGEILEIRRNVLYMLQRNPASREMLDRVYRQRALKDHLRSITLFEDLDEQERRDCVDFLRDRVSLLRVDPGQVIFRQGESVSRNNEFVGHFYMIRLGYVKVSSTFHGHERVMNYLGPNHFFGEIALLSKLPNLIDEHVPDSLVARRTATCTALDDVELVGIKGEHFSELILKYDKLRNKFVQICKAHLQPNREMLEPIGQPSAKFLDQGLFNAQTLLVLDLESCTRCDECTRACSDTHQGVVRLIREGLRFDKFLVASSCRSCQDPYCIVGCPVDSIHRTSSLEIVIEDHCIGCGQCAKNCPYGNINMHGYEETHEYPPESGRQVAVVRQRATTCDLCRNVVGPDEEVSCVYACPHHAAFRMSGAELQDIVAGKSHARADTSTRAALSR